MRRAIVVSLALAAAAAVIPAATLGAGMTFSRDKLQGSTSQQGDSGSKQQGDDANQGRYQAARDALEQATTQLQSATGPDDSGHRRSALAAIAKASAEVELAAKSSRAGGASSRR